MKVKDRTERIIQLHNILKQEGPESLILNTDDQHDRTTALEFAMKVIKRISCKKPFYYKSRLYFF